MTILVLELAECNPNELIQNEFYFLLSHCSSWPTCYCSLVIVNRCWFHFSSRKTLKTLSIRPCGVVYFVPKKVVVANWAARFEGVLNKCELPIVEVMRVWGLRGPQGPQHRRGSQLLNCGPMVPQLVIVVTVEVWRLGVSELLLKSVASPGLNWRRYHFLNEPWWQV